MKKPKNALAEAIEAGIILLIDTTSTTEREAYLDVIDRAIKWEALKRKTDDEEDGSEFDRPSRIDP